MSDGKKLGHRADPSTSTIRGLVPVPEMMMMRRMMIQTFDVVALLLQQEQTDAFGWIGQMRKGVNLDKAGMR
jgi:hypothetical protein